MDKMQKRNFRWLLVIAAAFFILFIFPNLKASQNPAMVQVFEPDEASPLPFLFHMIKPGESLAQTLKNFIFYDYYPYGFVYFAYSALVILPLQWLGLLENTTLVMVVLRQMVSVLPLLAALLILVYLQDEFRTYRSFLIFGVLAAVPAVIQNNLWWHPDGLATLFVTLTLFFLVRDRLRFGGNFILAAVTCGLATATKLIGVYFFLSIALVLALGLIQKRINLWKAFKMGLVFLLVMAATYFVASPFLLSHWARTEFITTMKVQREAIASGYGIVYAKGLAAAWPIVHQYYGELVFLLVGIGCMLWGVFRGSRKLTYALILTWFIPLSVTTFFLTHMKFQYWMPVALPMISCLALILPEKVSSGHKLPVKNWVQLALMLLLAIQVGLFVAADKGIYREKLHRGINDPAILFYDSIADSLNPVQNLPLKIEMDSRVYLPAKGSWTVDINYDLLNYPRVQDNQYDVLILMQQTIRDYLNPNAVGIDAAEFSQSQQFYRDADQSRVKGFKLLYQNDFGKIFISDDLYQVYYQHK
jgi:hypothetical protein